MTRIFNDPVHPSHPGATPESEHLSARCAQILRSLRTEAPLIQCITNTVVTGFTANVLLAVGASPAMVDIPEEAGLFAGIASGVLINLGTPHAEQRAAMLEAAIAAQAAGTPWVLDPVAVGSLPLRTAIAAQLWALQPSITRGNASEIIALAGHGVGGRGADSTAGPEDAREAAAALAQAGSAIAVSGPVDLLTAGGRSVRVASGTPMLTRITGGGCALGALMAACAAVHADALEAAVAATAILTVAAEIAEERSGGPGSFAAQLLDVLAELDPATLQERVVFA